MIKNSSKPSDGYSESPSSRPMTLRQQLQDALGKFHPAEDTIYELCQEITREAYQNPWDFVQPCEENCTPERHAFHEGQWNMAQRMVGSDFPTNELTHQPPKDEEK